MLNEYMDISIASGSFKTVKHIAEVLTKVILDKRPRLQLQCAEIAAFAQFWRQVQRQEIPGNIRLSQKLPECRIMWRGRAVVLFH